MAQAIVETGTLKATIYGAPRIQGKVTQNQTMTGSLGIPDIINYNPYVAGDGISIDDGTISVDFTLIDCGTSTTVI